ncbi:hypothetical protein DF046_21250 [Burkholderia cepacia]|uniref:hypothetical protein n=1 Tax=Burkholderia TaxID=32008 RepID=UPI000752B39F|nr:MULTISPECIES: hypothetical protein [Burkholderia]EMD9438213.1 hypothetical protein [Burkholderia cepacia]KVX50771.1 hypothetical protein WL06_26615 [Burkholderia cepacia]KWC69233.1 hypothetical protein WL56_37345 [Burkholderia cepacia]KWD60367.1 hypothetical protein WL68_23650 [Burkholderia cepacia]KWD70660.1 hypothetical protein WL69_03720 [Burkholderia cepacia]
MRVFHLPIVLASLLAALSPGARAGDLPKSIAAQLPAGYQPLLAQAGPDLDNGRHSFLVVVHRAVDTREQPSPRPLLIFEEQADHAFRLAARNDQVVLRANEGGQCDPFDPDDAADNGFAVKGRYFTVQNFVACGQHWTDYVTFRYDPHTHGWVFSNRIVTESFPLDDQPDHVTVTRADAHRPVSFGQWQRKD